MDMNAIEPTDPELRIPESPEVLAHVAHVRTAERAATALTGAIVALMAAASAAGLFVPDLYDEGGWAREALRGGDLVTLVLAAPLLLGTLVFSVRGSQRARVVWIGLLAYSVYNSAFYAFGASFNDAFVLHIALLSTSVFALACALVSTDLVAIAATFGEVRGTRWVGLFLVVVGVAQGLLWLFVLARNVATGELIEDVPPAGQHLVLALDLAFLVPTLVLSGVLLFRRLPLGYVLGAAMAVMGAVYQLNMMAAGVFQDRADVVGAAAFAPENVGLAIGFWAGALFLLVPRRRQGRAIS